MRNLILLLLISTACHGQPKEFSASQVTADISYLQEELENFHPGFYRYTSKAQMDQFFQDASRAANGLEGTELYARVTFLLSQVKCGHTRTSMPDQMRSSHRAESRFLPFHIQILGDEPYVSASLDKNLPVGARLIAINRKSYQELEQIIYDHLAADGFIETGKQRMISWLFPFYYQLYVDDSPGSVEVTYQTDEGQKTISVERVTDAEIEPLSSYKARRQELRLDHFADHSYMRITTFGQQALTDAGLNYERFLRQSFKSIKAKGVENLILDLRGNGGGRDNFGALLVSYLLPRTFGYFDNIEVTSNYTGYGGVVSRNGKRYVTSHQGLDQWEPQANVFESNLYVLIDGGSFSTCADVATVLHHNNRGVFLGQETGGGYDGNTSGNTRTISLPHSNITVYLPMWKYTTANIGHDFPGRGVIPDHQIIPTWDQYANGKDLVLEKAKELIRN